MDRNEKCSHCNHAKIQGVGVDCPICFQEQRTKMLLAGNAYLQLKASEGISTRRAPSHMYRNYTRNVADANSYQRDDARLFTQNTLPLLRQSELMNRITAHQNYSDQRIKPLPAAGAIPLHRLEPLPPPQKPAKSEDTEVFFDDAPYRESKYVFLNGEVYRGEKPLQEDRVIYGVDSPTAAVHAALRGAMRRSASTKAPSSEDVHTADSPTAQQKRSPSSSSRGTSAEQEANEEAPREFCREFVSSSGRRYRVVAVGKIATQRSANKADDGRSVKKETEGNAIAENKGEGSPLQSQHSSVHSRDKRRDSQGGKANKDEPEEPKSKCAAEPQKSASRHEDCKRRARRDRTRGGRHRSSPTRNREAAGRASPKPGYDNNGDRLPPISKNRSHKDHSSSPQQKREGSERGGLKAVNNKCRRRHVDSIDTDASLSSYFRSLRSDEFSPSKNADRNGKESDCVVTENPARPAHQPRKKRTDKKKRSRRRSSSLSNDSTRGGADRDHSRVTCHGRDNGSGAESDWSNVCEASPWSVLFGNEESPSTSSTSDQLSTLSSVSSRVVENEGSSKRADRRGHHGRQRNGRRSLNSSVSSRKDDGVAEKRTRKVTSPNAQDVDSARSSKKDARRSSRASAQELLSQSASTSAPAPCSGSGVDRPHQSQPPSPHRPPVVHAVVPPHPTGVLPPLAEEMIPSTRYELVCPSPVARVPRPSSPPPALSEATARDEKDMKDEASASGAADPVSPALGPPRADKTASSAINPLRRAYDEIPAEPLQVTHFNDLQHSSIASSGPVCSPSQGALNLLPRDRDAASALPSGAALDLSYITEHVLRVICDRLGYGGGNGMLSVNASLPQQSREAEAARSKSVAEREAEEAKERAAEAAVRRRAELLRLRRLLCEAHELACAVRDEKVPLDSLAASLKRAFAQAADFNDEDSLWADLAKEEVQATAPHTLPGNSVAADSGTLIYADGGRRLPQLVSEEATDAKLSSLDVDAATLERLLAELRERRTRHEAHQRELKAEEERKAKAAEAERQRRLAEEAAAQRAREEEEAERRRKATEEQAAAERALKEQQEREQKHRQAVAAFLAQETSARTAVRAEEKSAFDQLRVAAARSEDDSRRRSVAAQVAQFENERADLCEEELDARADLAAMEAAEAEDFWDVAARLWQAAADEAKDAEPERQERQTAVEAEEAARRKSAAWQAAQAKEAERMQAELRRLDDAAKQRRASQDAESGNRKQSASHIRGRGKLVRSNLIPNQILDVSQEDGKIRLVGDPYVAAVEARSRERRRADKVRQERLASAIARPPSTKAGCCTGTGDRRQSNREPSTVRISVVGSAVTPSAKKTGQKARRASTRRSLSSSRSRNSVDGDNIAPTRGRMLSQSSFVAEGDLNLGVEGQHVGTPYKTRSRTSSLASTGVPHMGVIFNAATPHKNRFADDETDALTSSGAAEAEF